MLTYTPHTLEKLEQLFKALNYKVRYEKGTFKTGACMLESSKIIVVNKFSNLENRINALAELVRTMALDEALLDEKQKKMLYTIKQTSLNF